MADCLRFVYRSSAIRKGLIAIPSSETLRLMYNFDNPETKTMFPRFDPTPHGVETPTLQACSALLAWVYGANITQGGCSPIPGSLILLYMYISDKPGTKTETPRVDANPIPHQAIADWLRFVYMTSVTSELRSLLYSPTLYIYSRSVKITSSSIQV